MSSVIDNNFPNDRTKLKGGYAMIDMRGILTNSDDGQTINDGGALYEELLAAVKSNKPIILCNMKETDSGTDRHLSPIHVYALTLEGETSDAVVIHSPSRPLPPYLVYRESDEEQTYTVFE